MEEERHYNETLLGGSGAGSDARTGPPGVRPRRVSSPVPYPSPSSSRPLSPGIKTSSWLLFFKYCSISYFYTFCNICITGLGLGNTGRCFACGQPNMHPQVPLPSSSPPHHPSSAAGSSQLTVSYSL